jgi:hypothetical protein
MRAFVCVCTSNRKQLRQGTGLVWSARYDAPFLRYRRAHARWLRRRLRAVRLSLLAPGALVYVTPPTNAPYYNGAPAVYPELYPGPYAPPVPVIAAPVYGPAAIAPQVYVAPGVHICADLRRAAASLWGNSQHHHAAASRCRGGAAAVGTGA